ncbi:MAG: ImpA family metalloprotease, partial [Gammaproteobacteria bacterium]
TPVDLTIRSSYVTSLSRRNIPLHATTSGRLYSVVGEFDGASRYAVLGTNMFRLREIQAPLAASTLNVVRWLMRESAPSDIRTQPLVWLARDTRTRNWVQQWITDNGWTTNWTLSTNLGLLDTEAYDIYIDRETTDPIGFTTKALASGKAVINVNDWAQQRDDLLALFDLEWRWWQGQRINEWSSVDEACEAMYPDSQVERLVLNLRDGMPDFDYTDPACTSSSGRVSCDAELVRDNTGRTQAQEFLYGASYIRDALAALDRQGNDVFGLGDDKRLEKLLVLLGDKYRTSVAYPMDKETTPDTDFYRAYFADHAVHYSRSLNTRPDNLGTFAPTPDSLDAIAGATRSLTFTPSIFTEWTSTGLYVPPGKSVTVRRRDASTNQVRIKFNFLRNPIRLWNTDGYAAPKFITSPAIELEAGRDYVLSTPYGGPVYVQWDGVAANPDSFEVEFEGALEHPFLDGSAPADIATFVGQLDTTPFEWIDIRTPFAEIHQSTAFTRDIIANRYGGDGARYVSELGEYLIFNNYWLAGLTGAEIPPLPAAVQDFCTANAFDCTNPVIHRRPRIQHFNGFNPSLCGRACAGNPIDVNSPIDPVAYVANHEMGHNLQRPRLKIYGGRSTEQSTNIFTSFTRSTYAADTGIEFWGTRAGNRTGYEYVQDGIANGQAPGLTHPLWVGEGDGMGDGSEPGRREFYHQLAYVNGSWHVYTQLYLVERLFTEAIKGDATWAAEKDKLFFSTYTRTQARDITAEDFMYVVLSCMSLRDHREWFEAWGVAVSALAVSQVAACGTTESVPLEYYHTDDGPIYAELPDFPSNILPLDGVSPYRDPDLDNDRARNEDDDLPFDPSETVDTDGDGIGNNADTDDDGDGMSDAFETTHSFDPLDASDGPLDSDSDGVSNADEETAGTLPRDAGSRPTTTVDAWIAAPALSAARTSHTATLLASGEVMVTGGANAFGVALATSELFDPAALGWRGSGALATARVGHSATRLDDGRVVVAGGLGPQFSPLASAEIYDPASGAWTPLAAMLTLAREKHTATLLDDGRVLVVGGEDENGALPSVEIFDPATGLWGAAAWLATERSGHSATRLDDGRVLVAGGRNNNEVLTSAELYDPITDAWAPAQALASPHHEHSASLLADAR